jgi:Condensation domain
MPVQVIHSPWEVALPVIDLCTVALDRREVEAERFILRLLQSQIDVTRLPLVYWLVVRLDQADHMLVQVEHHFLHDGWSFSVLMREVKAIYQAFSTGNPSPLAELSIQFADFAVWQRECMKGEVLDNLLDYWKAKLIDAPKLELPVDHPHLKGWSCLQSCMKPSGR